MIHQAMICTLLLTAGSAGTGHAGPDYGLIPAACAKDNDSRTYDNARGGRTVTWTDRFNKPHSVTVPDVGTVTVRFPIASGGSWIWFQPESPRQQRTGFNPNVCWIEAVFYLEDDHVRVQATGFLAPGAGPDPGLLGSVKDRVTDVNAIVSAGARTVEEVMKIAKAAGLLAAP